MSNSDNVACFGSGVVTMGGQIYWTKRRSLTVRVVGRMQMVVRVCTGFLRQCFGRLHGAACWILSRSSRYSDARLNRSK